MIEGEENAIVHATGIDIAAHCNRVPVTDGHMACVSLEFKGAKPDLLEIANIWQHFSGVPQEIEEGPVAFEAASPSIPGLGEIGNL